MVLQYIYILYSLYLYLYIYDTSYNRVYIYLSLSLYIYIYIYILHHESKAGVPHGATSRGAPPGGILSFRNVCDVDGRRLLFCSLELIVDGQKSKVAAIYSGYIYYMYDNVTPQLHIAHRRDIVVRGTSSHLVRVGLLCTNMYICTMCVFPRLGCIM